ncbi:MAG: rRNA maturation RNase YbeY [Pseudomonadota bacterium]
MTLSIDLRIADPAWSAIEELDALCARALNAAWTGRQTASVDVLLADDTTLAGLNADWRGKNGPTDVLSFPAENTPGGFLGDIAIAHGVCLRDAQADGKNPADHLCHLLIHGLLHLMGHDHIDDDEANTMEALERAAMNALGLPDPYRRIDAS